MKLPLDIKDITNASKRIREEREQPVRIAVFTDVDAPDALLDAVRTRFVPYTSGARLHIAVAEPGLRLSLASDVDAVLAIVSSGAPSLRESLAEARERHVPVVAVALGENRDLVSGRLGHPLLDTLVGMNAEELVDDRLAEWLVDRLSSKRLALAANFAFMRRVIAEESVKATSFQNAVIGVVMIIPGADMPLMTANQAKMLLQIAAAYGEPLGTERIKELAAVVGGGLALRTLAREMVAFVPGVGWALKGGIAYAGTLAMGTAAIAYFERGADFGEVLEGARAARDRAVREAKARIGRGEKLDVPRLPVAASATGAETHDAERGEAAGPGEL